MLRTAGLFLGLFLFPSAHADHSPWRQSEFANKATFTQTKYYSFYSKELSAEIIYLRVSPSLANKFVVAAHIVYQGQNYSMMLPAAVDSITESKTSAELTIGDTAGIKPQTDGSVIIFNRAGKIHWHLKIMPGLSNPFPLQFLPLDGKDFGLDWNIGWKPEFMDGTVVGDLSIAGKKVPVNSPGAYHDDTFGNWNFFKQTYFWFAFSGNDARGKRMHVLFGDLFKNSVRPIGLNILDTRGNTMAHYLPGTYTIELQNIRRANFVAFDLFADYEQFSSYVSEPTNASFPFAHEVPSRVLVKTKDGRVKVTLDVETIFAAYPILSLANLRYGNTYIDDYVIRGTLEMENGTKMSSRGGMQYLRNSRESVRVVEDFNR